MTTLHGVIPLPTDHPYVFAFRITQDLDADGMAEIAQMLNTAFDQHRGKVNVLLIFEGFALSDAGVGFKFSSMKAKLRSLANIHRYAVVGAPKAAARMVDFFGHIIPVQARSFAADDAQAAWDFVNTPENTA